MKHLIDFQMLADLMFRKNDFDQAMSYFEHLLSHRPGESIYFYEEDLCPRPDAFYARPLVVRDATCCSQSLFIIYE